MEVDRVREYIYSDTELDRVEGQVIEELKASSQQPVPDPDEADADQRAEEDDSGNDGVGQGVKRVRGEIEVGDGEGLLGFDQGVAEK